MRSELTEREATSRDSGSLKQSPPASVVGPGCDPFGSVAAALRLQRAAGNRAVASLARRQSGRGLARCANDCACCDPGTRDDLLETDGAQLLRSAVEARAER